MIDHGDLERAKRALHDSLDSYRPDWCDEGQWAGAIERAAANACKARQIDGQRAFPSGPDTLSFEMEQDALAAERL